MEKMGFRPVQGDVGTTEWYCVERYTIMGCERLQSKGIGLKMNMLASRVRKKDKV